MKAPLITESLNLTDGLLVDLDNRKSPQPTDFDIVTLIGPSGDGLLTTLNGARVGLVANAVADYASCVAADIGFGEIELDQNQFVTNLCLETSDGAIVSARVIARTAQGKQMILRYYLWD